MLPISQHLSMENKESMLFTLNNGIRVLLLPTDTTQTVSVGVFVNTGSANETVSENGISHFLEHMAFKGTKRRSYNKISSDAERLGADMNAFTDRDMTAYFIKGLSAHATIFVDILGDIFCNSTFAEDEIEKECEVILQEYRMYADKPHYVAQDMSYSLAYPDHAFGRKIIGEPKNIRSWDRMDFQSYLQKHYGGDNVIVGVSGNFDEDEVLTAIEKSFSKVYRGNSGMFVRTAPTFVGGSAVKKKSIEQCAVSIMYDAVSVHDPLYYAYEVAVGAVGHGMSSPLFDEIREKRGLVYSVGAGADIHESSGTISVTAGTTADKLDELFTAVTQVFQSSSEKIRPIDMERAKNSICVSLATGHERPFNRLLNSVQSIFTYGEIRSIESDIEKIRAVTPAQVKKVIAKILDAKKSVVVVGNKVDLDVVKRFAE